MESITVNVPGTNEYRTTPKPIYIRTYPTTRQNLPTRQNMPCDWLKSTCPPVRPETTDWSTPTAESIVTQSLYKPWNPETASTEVLTGYPIRTTRRPSWRPSRISTTPRTTRQETTTPATSAGTPDTPGTPDTLAQEKLLRIQPGTIVMMDSEYLKEKYALAKKPALAKSFHRALLADYFGLSESEMKEMRMTVVAWGFSYQVKDKAKNSPVSQKFFCDFKFRSTTFNRGYVGAHINMNNSAELNGYDYFLITLINITN